MTEQEYLAKRAEIIANTTDSTRTARLLAKLTEQYISKQINKAIPKQS